MSTTKGAEARGDGEAFHEPNEHGAIVQEQSVGDGEQQIWRECRKCNRGLKNPKSQKLGYGPVCLKRMGLGGK